MALGRRVACPVCDRTFHAFADYPEGTPDRRCWECGSLERHRGVALLWRGTPDMVRSGMRVLHVAPEPSLGRLLARAGAHVTGGDLEPGPDQVRLDVTAMPEFEDGHFDAVVCMHVLEHVPDDAAALRELRRVLRPDGWAVLNTPVTAAITDEDPTVTDPAERLRRFGQDDHVRRYGADLYDRIRAAGFTIDLHTPQTGIERFRLRAPSGVEPVVIAR